jgi:mannosyltransferase OCH1-like enzyme
MTKLCLIVALIIFGNPRVYTRTHKVHLQAVHSPLDINLSQAAQIPKIVHQSWKENYNLQVRQKLWRQTWIDQNPGWKVVLWSDDENKQLVKQHYPWLLDFFNSLHGVYRADMVRSLKSRQATWRSCIL